MKNGPFVQNTRVSSLFQGSTFFSMSTVGTFRRKHTGFKFSFPPPAKLNLQGRHAFCQGRMRSPETSSLSPTVLFILLLLFLSRLLFFAYYYYHYVQMKSPLNCIISGTQPKMPLINAAWCLFHILYLILIVFALRPSHVGGFRQLFARLNFTTRRRQNTSRWLPRRPGPVLICCRAWLARWGQGGR